MTTLLTLSGEVFETYHYTVFGEEENPSSLNPWRYSSKRHDPESGFIYFGRRYYAPDLGRWVTTDPIGFDDGPNLYAYLQHSPLMQFDLYGLAAGDAYRDVKTVVSHMGDLNYFNDRQKKERERNEANNRKHPTFRERGSNAVHLLVSPISSLIHGFEKDAYSSFEVIYNLFSVQSPPLNISKENQNSSSFIHQSIDCLFSTNLAFLHTPEAIELRNDQFTFGEMPSLSNLAKGGFIGKKGWELKNSIFQPIRNKVTKINKLVYRGHALDQMQNRGIPPSVVENAIKKGILKNFDKERGTYEYFDSTNKIKVIINEKNEIVTVYRVDNVR